MTKTATEIERAVKAHRALMAARAEKLLIDAAIRQASERIAAGFSTRAKANQDEDITRLRLATWGEA